MVSDSGSLVRFVDVFRPSDHEAEVVAQVQRLSRQEIGGCVLLAILAAKVHVLGGAKPWPNTIMERHGAFQDPPVRSDDH
jgi:hypothetical protein